MATATYSAKVGAGGTATVTVKTGSMRAWVVAQVSVELASAPVGATCDIRKNGYLITPVIPTGDVASGEPYVLLDPTDTLTINWAGCTLNTVAKALVFYEEK